MKQDTLLENRFCYCAAVNKRDRRGIYRQAGGDICRQIYKFKGVADCQWVQSSRCYIWFGQQIPLAAQCARLWLEYCCARCAHPTHQWWNNYSEVDWCLHAPNWLWRQFSNGKSFLEMLRQGRKDNKKANGCLGRACEVAKKIISSSEYPNVDVESLFKSTDCSTTLTTTSL